MKTVLGLLCPFLFFPIVSAYSGEQALNSVVARFLPPGTKLADLRRFDPKTGNSVESTSAILSGHFVSSSSSDLAFAYVNESEDPQSKSLFVTVLHQGPDGYAVVFEKSFYERFLWVQDFSTVGFKLLKLPGESKDSIVIATARGASLGLQTEIYHWEDGIGMVNIMPEHPSAHHISLLSSDSQFAVRLSFEKYPGEKGVPQPMIYRWNGHELARAAGT